MWELRNLDTGLLARKRTLEVFEKKKNLKDNFGSFSRCSHEWWCENGGLWRWEVLALIQWVTRESLESFHLELLKNSMCPRFEKLLTVVGIQCSFVKQHLRVRALYEALQSALRVIWRWTWVPWIKLWTQMPAPEDRKRYVCNWGMALCYRHLLWNWSLMAVDCGWH